MKKVKVYYMAGSEVREVDLGNVHHWEAVTHEVGNIRIRSVAFLSEENELLAEFTNVVAVMRV